MAKVKTNKSRGNKSGKQSRSAASAASAEAHVTVIASRRRAKLTAAREAATASADLAGLDERLDVTDAELRDLQARRAEAERQLLGLLDAIGTAELNRSRIRTERKHARSRAAATREVAVRTERKYERAVLAQLLDADRAADRAAETV